MEQFLEALINGIMLGGFYGVMVLGFSVIWGVMGVINLAHGELVMVGAYITWVLNKQYGWEPFLALIVGSTAKPTPRRKSVTGPRGDRTNPPVPRTTAEISDRNQAGRCSL